MITYYTRTIIVCLTSFFNSKGYVSDRSPNNMLAPLGFEPATFSCHARRALSLDYQTLSLDYQNLLCPNTIKSFSFVFDLLLDIDLAA